ncbi:MAG: 4Fe-4S dicluster domain-containing protein, partial [Bacteroidaceae bacterium]|nr:4Fe-4S dicluster domain-containing protein [Bacteroidaceae bacterium]
QNERLGFCFPTHGWMPPTIVRNFINKLHISNVEGHYCYALTTCGDDIGQCMKELQKALQKKGWHASSVFSLIMPESYVCLPGFLTDTEEIVQQKITKAHVDLQHVAKLIQERYEDKELVRKGSFPNVKTYVLGKPFNRWLITDKPFKVATNLCIHCGKCAQACPVNNISMEGNPSLPQWHHDGNCTNCLACYHVCPKHAINYWDTKKKGQYYFKTLE